MKDITDYKDEFYYLERRLELWSLEPIKAEAFLLYNWFRRNAAFQAKSIIIPGTNIVVHLKKNQSWTGTISLAEKLGTTRKIIRRRLQILRDLGYIRVETHKSRQGSIVTVRDIDDENMGTFFPVEQILELWDFEKAACFVLYCWIRSEAFATGCLISEETEKVQLQHNQCQVEVPLLAERFDVSQSFVEGCISELVEMNYIAVDDTGDGQSQIIAVRNIRKFDKGPAEGQPRASRGPTLGQPWATNKKDYKDHKDNKDKRGKGKPIDEDFHYREISKKLQVKDTKAIN